MKSILAACLLSLMACNERQYIDTDKDVFLVEYRFYDYKKIEEYCGKGNVGCVKNRSDRDIVYTVRERCVLDHEMDHVFYGAFHGFERVTCKVRAK